jgi:hypothetical protein
MTGLAFPDVSVQLTQRRWRCVLDPHLALSRFGAEFARRLAPTAETWFGTELLNILDNARIYRDDPKLLAGLSASNAEAQLISDALRDWIHLRDAAGYGGNQFHWIGDVLRESCMPAGMNGDVAERWEVAARSLDARLPQALEASGPVIAAIRDTVALGAILPAAAILTLRSDPAPIAAPLLCGHIKRWGLPCAQLDDRDELVVIERDWFRRLLVQAGLAKFVWGGLDLAVLHLHGTKFGRLDSVDDGFANEHDELANPEPELNAKGAWDDASAFWYRLGEDSHAG